MESLETLNREHVAIGAVLDRFESVIETALASGELDVAAFDRLLSFFEERVDGQHQEQEERVFLPRVFTRARGEEARRVRSILDEHLVERSLLVQMRCALLDGRAAELAKLAQLVRQYVRHQRRHIAWEDTVIVPLARRVLSPRDDRAIRNGWKRFRETWGGDVEEAARRLASWLDHRSPRMLA